MPSWHGQELLYMSGGHQKQLIKITLETGAVILVSLVRNRGCGIYYVPFF
jgi:hypothetical protein